MSITAAELVARVTVQGAEKAEAQLLGLGRGSDNAGLKLAGLAAGGVALAAAALIGVGAVAVHMAGDFEASTNRLVTSAGEQNSNIGKVRSAILGLSVDTATGTDQLVKSWYMASSAGFNFAHGGLDVVRAAAMGAKAEGADLGKVTDVLTTAMHDFHLPVSQAVDVVNSFIRTVAEGKGTMDDLTGAMRNVLPIAAAAHVHLKDVEGAIATMSLAGDKGTQAGTHLAQMLTYLLAPSSKATGVLKEVGLTTQGISDEMKKSLPGAIEMITKAVGEKFPVGSAKYIAALSAIVGGNRSMKAMLELSGQNLQDYIAHVNKVAPALSANAKQVENWGVIQSGFNFKLDAAKNAVGALFIKLGTALLPVLGQMLEKIIPLITNFGNWETKTHGVEKALAVVGTVLSNMGQVIGTVASGIGQIIGFFASGSAPAQAVAIALGMIAGALAAVQIGAFVAAIPALVAGFIAWGVAAWSAAVATIAATWPLLLIGAAVALVIAGIILAVQHWGQITAWIGGVMSALGSKVHDILGAIGGAFSALGTKTHDVLSGIGSFVGNVFSGLGTKVHDALNAVATFAINKFNDILNFVHSIPGKIGAALATLAGILLAPFKWFYDHNIYVKLAVDTIILDLKNLRNLVGNIFSAIGTFIHDKLVWIQQTTGAIFSAIGTFIHDRLVWIQNTTGAIFSAIGTFIHDRLTWIKNTVGSIFSAIGTFIHDKLTAAKNDVGNIFSVMGSLVQGKVTDLKNAVGNAFSALGSMMHDKLTAAWNGLVSFASGWPSAAFNWGVNLVQGLVNGLGSMLGAVRDKVGQIAGAIGNFLGFHSPAKEGPGADADTWMPNLINMFVRDLSAGQGKMKAALAGLMTPLAASMHVSATGSLSGITGASGGAFTPSASRYSFPLAGGAPTIVVNVQSPDVNLDGWRVTDRLMPHIASKIRYNTPGGMGR